MSFWEYIVAGEYVIIALGILFIIALWIWIDRTDKLVKDDKKYNLMLSKVRDFIAEGDIENAVGICRKTQTSASLVMAKGLSMIGNPMEVITSSMIQESTLQKENYGNGGQWLKFISVISPLLGIGGTMAGIWSRLMILTSDGGVVDIPVISEAVAPALFTTIAGLFVGIMSLLCFTCLNVRVKKTVKNIYKAIDDVENILNQPS